METMSTSKFRRGDIVLLRDPDSNNKHYNIIVNHTFETCEDYGGHGQMWQVMKMSLSKPKEYFIPFRHNADTSFIIAQNMYSIHAKDMNSGIYSGYVPDEHIIDLAVNIHSSLCLSKVPSETLQEITKMYNSYIEEFIKVYGPIKDDYHRTASKAIVPKKDTYYSINNQQNKPKPVVHTPHSLYDTFLTIPENITAIGRTLDKSIEMAENIVTSDKAKVRSVPRFTKQWLDSELLLFYILFVNDKTCIGKSYGYSDKTVDRRLETVMSILKERSLIS